MSDFIDISREELIEEVQRLRQLLEQNGNGHIEEEQVFELASEAEGEEVFLVSETGRFHYVSDSMLELLGYARDEMLRISLQLVDGMHSRGPWLALVSRLKRSEAFEEYEAEHKSRDGARFLRTVSARSVSLNGKKYVLCVARPPASMSGETDPDAGVPKPGRSREYVLLGTLGEGVMFVDTRGTILESNLAAARLLGAANSDLVGRSCVDSRWRLVNSEGRPLGISDHPVMVALVEEQVISNRRLGIGNADGSRREFLMNASPLYDAESNLIGAIGCFRPVGEAVQAMPVRQESRSSLGTMFREIIAVTLAARTEHELERRVIDTLVEYGEYPLTWRSIVQEGDVRMRTSYAAGEEEEFLMKVKMRFDDSDHGNGPVGMAIKTGEAQLVDDTQDDAGFSPWREQAAKHNLFSMTALPLRYGERDCGVLSVCADERGHFTDAEYSILKDVAELFAFGLSTLHSREETERKRLESLERDTVLEIMKHELPAAIAIFESREPFSCTYANSAFLGLVDEPYHSRGAEGAFVTDFMHSCYHQGLYPALQQAGSGEAVRGTGEEFRDWQGSRGSWDWKVLPVTADGTVEKLLYIAAPASLREPAFEAPAATPPDADAASAPTRRETVSHGPDTATDGEAPAPSSPTMVRADSSAGDGTALLCVLSPVPPPRSRKDKRISLFFEQGRIVRASRAAAALLGGNGELQGDDALARYISADGDAGRGIAAALSDDGAGRHFTAAAADGRVHRWTLLAHNQEERGMETWLLLSPLDT